MKKGIAITGNLIFMIVTLVAVALLMMPITTTVILPTILSIFQTQIEYKAPSYVSLLSASKPAEGLAEGSTMLFGFTRFNQEHFMIQVYSKDEGGRNECSNYLTQLRWADKAFPTTEECKDSFCICFGTYNMTPTWEFMPWWSSFPGTEYSSLKNISDKLAYKFVYPVQDAKNVVGEFCADFFESSLFADGLIISINCAPLGDYFLSVADEECIGSEATCGSNVFLWVHWDDVDNLDDGVNIWRQDVKGYDLGTDAKFINSLFWVG